MMSPEGTNDFHPIPRALGAKVAVSRSIAAQSTGTCSSWRQIPVSRCGRGGRGPRAGPSKGVVAGRPSFPSRAPAWAMNTSSPLPPDPARGHVRRRFVAPGRRWMAVNPCCAPGSARLPTARSRAHFMARRTVLLTTRSLRAATGFGAPPSGERRSGQGVNRTPDTQIFSLLLCQLSYLARPMRTPSASERTHSGQHAGLHGHRNCARRQAKLSDRARPPRARPSRSSRSRAVSRTAARSPAPRSGS